MTFKFNLTIENLYFVLGSLFTCRNIGHQRYQYAYRGYRHERIFQHPNHGHTGQHYESSKYFTILIYESNVN